MNIFEYDKSKWEDIGCGFTFVVVCVIGLITFLMYLILGHYYYSSLTENAGGAFLTFIDVCTINKNIVNALPFVMWNTFLVLCVCVILYLFMRLLYKSYLFVTGQLWKSENESWALSAVKRMNNQNKLKRVFKEKSVYIHSVRLAAVKRITDQEFLKDRAINDSDSYVRLEAADKLYVLAKDDDSLRLVISAFGEILRIGTYNDRTMSAVERLHSLYKKCSNESIRDSIRKFNGTIIRQRISNTRIEYESIEQANCPCTNTGEEVVFSDHTDHPAVYFYAE
ncbi:hypothetical protein FACS189415_2650 [Bacteroidia bacterium]|nr:hypothetical protein FACS189415_2650 [Bacteroidia bacterium]